MLKKIGLVVGTLSATMLLSCGVFAATEVKQTDDTKSSAKIQWDKETNGNSIVEVSNTADFSQFTSNDVPRLNNYTIKGMSSGSSRWVRVKENNHYTDIIEVVSRPEKVRNNFVTQTGCQVGKALVGWTASDGATGYEVYVGGNYAFDVNTNKATIDVSNATENIRAQVLPFRQSSDGYKALASEKVNMKTLTYLKGLPSKVAKLDFKQEVSSSIHVMWPSVKGADGYEFTYSNYKGKKTVTKESSYSGGYISSANRIFYKVKARAYVDFGGKRYFGAWSDEAYTGVDLSYGVNNLKAKKVSKKKIKLSWNRIQGADKYVIYMSSTNGSGFKKIKTTKKRNLVIKKFGKKKLKKGTTYYFKVVATKKVGSKKFRTVYDSQKSLTLN